MRQERTRSAIAGILVLAGIFAAVFGGGSASKHGARLAGVTDIRTSSLAPPSGGAVASALPVDDTIAFALKALDDARIAEEQRVAAEAARVAEEQRQADAAAAAARAARPSSPAPAPAPRATGCAYESLIRATFPEDGDWMVAKAMSESGCNPCAFYPGRSDCTASPSTAKGLFQLLGHDGQIASLCAGMSELSDVPGYLWWANPSCNARVARSLYDSSGRRPWGG